MLPLASSFELQILLLSVMSYHDACFGHDVALSYNVGELNAY
jgi:hypothetical protein